jgi:predicted xylose isomerase-like sugar epimerase
MSAKQRDLKEAALGQKTELRRYVGQRDRSIHKTQMIRNKDVAARGINSFEPFDMNTNAAYRQQRSGPGPRDADLQSAGVVEE